MQAMEEDNGEGIAGGKEEEEEEGESIAKGADDECGYQVILLWRRLMKEEKQ
jgi:hypothetical protein